VLATAEVREAMLATLPSLRAFAISLTGNRDAADDLVQDAILRAWTNLDKFEPGSSMTAWLFTILRNAFYSEYRKSRREVDDPDGLHAGRLGTPPNQSCTRVPGVARSACQALAWAVGRPDSDWSPGHDL